MMDKQNPQWRARTKDRRYLGYQHQTGVEDRNLTSQSDMERENRLSEGYNWAPAHKSSAGKTV